MMEKQLAAQVVTEVKKAVVGKDDIVIKALLAILARGHLLLEDIPGVGKTTLAIAFSKALGLKYNRVQFTPDVMPSDLTGFSLYNKATGQMEYQPGALLCNLFLADELNRATSRTQSALLEAMEEGRVTVDGVSRPVPDPFLVIATQNPAGASGTQLLPDSQLDRFALRLSMGYPAPADELELLQRKLRGDAMGEVAQAADARQLADLRAQVERVFIDDEILQYILQLVRATRNHRGLAQGASPRAAISLCALCRGVAYLRGRDYVVPGDVSYIWTDAIAHRLVLPAGTAEVGTRAADIAGEVLNSVRPPRLR